LLQGLFKIILKVRYLQGRREIGVGSWKWGVGRLEKGEGSLKYGVWRWEVKMYF